MSAKTSAQPGRRTPLSLNQSGPKQQQQLPKPSPGPSASNSGAKNDNKTTKEQKTETKVAETGTAPATAELKDASQKDTKKQTNTDKKQQQNNAEKNEEKKTQNGVGKVNAKEKQQQQQQQQVSEKNGSDNQAKEKKDKTDKTEKVEKNDKPVKVVEKPDSKEEQKVKDVVEIKEKKEDEKKPAEKKAAEKVKTPVAEKKPTEKPENMDMSVEGGAENTVVTPKKPVIEKKTATPTKPQVAEVEKVTPSKSTTKAITPVKPTIMLPTEDVEMEPLLVEPSPIKIKPKAAVGFEPTIATIIPTATSTPGKTLKNKKVEVALPGGGCSPMPDRNACPRRFSQIAGRRSIRPISNEYTPSQFNSNSQFRESYRRINTELDVTSTTNTSLNVTVGSEVPNNSSLSMFFGRALGGRKRERTPPNTSLSTIDLQAEFSPPKRARLDMQGFFSAVVGSPLSMLRSRFSKTTIHSSSTPVKLRTKLAAAEDEEEVCEEVQNVSGISIQEEIPNGAGEEINATDDVTVGNEADETEHTQKDTVSPTKKDSVQEIAAPAEGDDAEQLNLEKSGLEKSTTSADRAGADNSDDIKITDAANVAVDVDPVAKNKRCSIM